MTRNGYTEKLREDMFLRGLSESTQKSYERVVKEFLAYSGKEPTDLDERDVRRYSIELVGKGYKREHLQHASGGDPVFLCRNTEPGHDLPADPPDEK